MSTKSTAVAENTAVLPTGLVLSPDLRSVLEAAPSVAWIESGDQLRDLSLGGEGADVFEVAYDVPGKGRVPEATVTRTRNGVAVNFHDPYMRRRDPDSMVIGDRLGSDKVNISDRLELGMDELREAVFGWLADQDLLVLAIQAGGERLGYPALLVAPRNAAFFAAGLAELQQMVPMSELGEEFEPRAVIYLAPPFRHLHCDGRQVVVHCRSEAMHEIFSLNLYLGPSAKKGIYGVLLSIGEAEKWVTAHCSVVQAITPYDNIVTIMHEGPSGCGKSEMLEYPHVETDGRLMLGHNQISGEMRHLSINQFCQLQPVTDDMALCHPSIQDQSGRLTVTDAEAAWFVRVDHIHAYGVDPYLERLCTTPPRPILFLNIHAVPNATALIWEPVEDAPGQPCPNPRVILPREIVPQVVNDPVSVDVRNFGLRQPPCTGNAPTYGIVGMLHFLPPALAWLWRLVAPRGYLNPSIVGGSGLESEGVGSYWPFATGRRVDQANLLLDQMVSAPNTRYTLTPNQNIGAWRVGFMPQWMVREYLARRGGAHFRQDQISPARCSLLGYAMDQMRIEGQLIDRWFTQVDTQPEVGEEAYMIGAGRLTEFFKATLRSDFSHPELASLGREIIECALDDGGVSDYEKLMPAGGPT